MIDVWNVSGSSIDVFVGATTWPPAGKLRPTAGIAKGDKEGTSECHFSNAENSNGIRVPLGM
jgi:hypothetical protein